MKIFSKQLSTVEKCNCMKIKTIDKSRIECVKQIRTFRYFCYRLYIDLVVILLFLLECYTCNSIF